MVITSGNLLVRSARIGDAKQLTQWWNDGDFMAHAGFPYGLNIQEGDIEKDIEAMNPEEDWLLMIEKDDQPIGEMGCRFKEGNVAEIGIKICLKAGDTHVK